MMKMNIPVQEAQDSLAQLEVSGMGYLFENAEKMDIQAERKNTKEQRERADSAEQEAATARQKAADAEQEAAVARQKAADAEQEATTAKRILDLFVKDLIQNSRASGHTREEIQHILQSTYSLKEDDAKSKIEKYWN